MIETTQPVDTERLDLPSASSMERYIACPGSANAERGLPPLPTLSVTQQGTDIHEAMETGDATGLEESEQEIAVRLERMERQTLENWSAALNLDVSVSRVPEQRFWVRNRQSLELVASAKLDTHYVAGKHALIIDFKSGYKKATSAEHNWQLITQAVALWHEHPEIEHARVAIAASRLTSTVDVADFDVDQLRYGEFSIMAAVWRAKAPNAPRNPGPWCQYCRAQAHCPSAAAYASLVLFLVPKHDKLAVLEYTQRMELPQLAEIQLRAPIALVIYEAIKERLKTFSEAELASVGFGLRPGPDTRSVENTAAAAARLTDLLPHAVLFSCLKLSLGKAEKAVKETLNLKSKEAAEQINTTLAGLITVRKNKPSLVQI